MQIIVRWAAIVGVFLSGCCGSAFAQATTAAAGAAGSVPAAHPVYPGGDGTELGRKIAAILADPAVARAHWGIAVAGMDGALVWGVEEGKLFRPASNAKLFTTAAAMALLWPAPTETRLYLLGHQGLDATPVVDGVFDGDIRIEGGGDSNLGSGRTFPYHALAAGETQPTAPLPLQDIVSMAASVAARGIKRVTGSITGDDTLWTYEPVPDTWGVDDLLWGYGAPVSALTVNDNEVKLTVTPGKVADAYATAALTPDVGYYMLDASQVKTGAAGEANSLRIERSPASGTIRITGRLPVGTAYVTELSIDDPAKYAAAALKAALAADGVVVEGAALAKHRLPQGELSFWTESRTPVENLPVVHGAAVRAVSVCSDNCQVLNTKVAPVVTQDVVVTLKESQNLHAEILLRWLGMEWGSEGTAAQGSRVVRQWLTNAGIDGDDFVLYDGSGLSSHDLVTPRATVQLLSFAAKQPWFAAWKASLPLGGVDGTLERRFTDAPLKGKVFAKTGTLGESRALSGYVVCASGKELLFSIMVDNHAPGISADRVAMDKIVAAIAAAN